MYLVTTRIGALYSAITIDVGQSFRAAGATVTRQSHELYRANDASGALILIGPARLVIDRLFPPPTDPHAERLARLREMIGETEEVLR